MAALEAIDNHSFATKTPWYVGATSFSGVRLSRLFSHLGAGGRVAKATALNDYCVDIPVSDFASFSPIIATKRDGRPMPVSEKGPLFIVYPYDTDPQLQHQVFYSRSVWQLSRIEFA